jgi:hypothetical protein
MHRRDCIRQQSVLTALGLVIEAAEAELKGDRG